MIAPIVLFVYNRPDHTRRTIEALKKNHLADQSDLFIFSDAPKNKNSEDLVKMVRAYLKSVSGFNSVNIVERSKNLGLANSIVTGVTEIVERLGRIIVLEDDIVTAPTFLQYMNEALEVYQNESKVMHISGYFFPTSAELPQTFFYRQAFSWGWATWHRAWRHFKPEASDLVSSIERIPGGVNKFNIDKVFNFFSSLKANAEGRIKTWAVLWYASIFILNGLCLHPHRSLVINIGSDGSGEHFDTSNAYNSNYQESVSVSVKKQPVEESLLALAEAKKFLKKIKPSFYKRIINRILNNY